MTTLAALAGVTSRIRLGLLVAGVTYRHPSVFAAQAVTIDHASHGRLELSLGAAWFDKEHDELGIPFPSTPERFDLLEDTLEIVQRLFTGEIVSYEGKVVSLAGRQPAAPPVQHPRPPIWIGGSGPGAPCRSSPSTPTCGTPGARPTRWRRPTPASTSSPSRRAVTRRRSRGPARCPSTTSRPPASTPSKWRDAGCGYLVCGWPEAGRSQVEAFARDVMPEFADPT